MALLLCVGSSAPLASAAPITFSTALAVSQGEGIVRLQFKLTRATSDPSPADRELEVVGFPLVAVYGATPKLTLFADLPLVDKSLGVITPEGRQTRGVSGLGDTTLLVRYTALQRDERGKTVRVAPFVGIEAPTGRDDAEDSLGRLPRPLQLGSASCDYLLGVVATRQTLAWQLDSSLSYKLNTAANDFEFGDVARLDLSFQRRLWPRELGSRVPAFFYGVLESNLVWADRNHAAGFPDPDSGGTTGFLAPGVQYVTKRIIVEGAIQVPVVQDLNGQALENDFIATLSARLNF